MKILIVSEFFPTRKDIKFSGGVEARNFFVAKNLSKKHNVTIITSNLERAKAKEKLFSMNVLRVGPKRRYSPVTGDLLQRIAFIREAIKEGKKQQADIVEGTNFITHFIAKEVARNKKIPSIAWYPDVWIGSWIKNAGIMGIFGEVLERVNLARGFDAYIAISKETANKIKKIIKSEAHTIYCGVDLKEFKSKAIKFPNPTIITIARLSKYKNIRTLLLAFAHLTLSIPKAQLIIVGSGPQEKELKDLSKNLKIEKKVRLYSNLSRKDLVTLIKKSHIFCLPSYVEGFGIATIEAAAAGLPYVNSNIPIQKEITKNGRGGFLVDPNNPISFSKKLKLLISDKKIYNKKSVQALSLSQSYDWSDISNSTEKLYKSVYESSRNN
ncbi:MAG: glycosyltransferase family 4 protein [Candidatus Curtissbacteria bacterium]|nr:glycosyltransferase family 4 protein [Candidatus Curtissbacteria bacterium]